MEDAPFCLVSPREDGQPNSSPKLWRGSESAAEAEETLPLTLVSLVAPRELRHLAVLSLCPDYYRERVSRTADQKGTEEGEQGDEGISDAGHEGGSDDKEYCGTRDDGVDGAESERGDDDNGDGSNGDDGGHDDGEGRVSADQCWL